MESKRLPKILTRAETEAFRSVINHPRDRAAVSLKLDAGLRASEVANLRLQNLIWDERIIRLVGKGQKEAEIPISNRLRDELEQAIHSRPSQANHDFVLWDIKNPSKPISRFALFKMVRTYGKKAGIPFLIHPHMLRHTFGTELYRATGDLGTVQKALRHSRPETTAIYVHLAAEDQRRDFEAIDKRPWFVKQISRLKPNMIPELLKPKPRPFYIGETIGREQEITALRKACAHRRNTLLIGEEGVGRKHLLKALYNEKRKQGELIYQLDEFRPARAAAIELCEQLQADGLIEELPKDRTDKSFIGIIQEIAKQKPLTLIIYSLNDVGKNEIRALRRLAESMLILSAMTPEQKPRLKKIFFGNYQELSVENFGKDTAIKLAEKALAGMSIPDKTAYLNHIYQESGGNPRALIELIQATQQTGELEPEHLGREKVLPAVYLLTVIWTAVVISRYPASTLSQPQWRVWATIIVFGLLPFIVFDKLLKMRRK